MRNTDTDLESRSLKGFDVTTFGGTGCTGANQGETLIEADHKCVNWSNAKSFNIHVDPNFDFCTKVKAVKFAGLNCGGANLGTSTFDQTGNQCYPHDGASNSAKFSCEN